MTKPNELKTILDSLPESDLKAGFISESYVDGMICGYDDVVKLLDSILVDKECFTKINFINAVQDIRSTIIQKASKINDLDYRWKTLNEVLFRVQRDDNITKGKYNA